MSTDRPMLGRRTYLDANLYVYAFEGIETCQKKMAGVYHLLALLPDPDARYHVPLIAFPHGYPVWWSG